AEPALPAAGEPATPLVVHLGTGPRPIPLPAGSSPLGLEAAPEGGRLLATTRDGRRLELGDEPLLLESLAFEPFAYARERVEPIALVGPDGATVLRVEVGIAIHPCDLEAGWRFDTQGVALGRYPNEVDGGPAIAACLEAVEAYPAVPRFRGQLGRARVLSGRYAEGVADLEAAAAGHLASRWMLGSLLDEGRGVPADPARGVALLRSAAEAGDPGAMNELGRLHLRGGAVPKDRDRVVDWLERAAAAGHTFAYNNLGNLLLQ
ncbi:MAG: sel1 repeat family protein, partial [Geminicoccaceae bacterium]|nr:sel1 repeat family protein [Geminicoccaceae bacterium]MDW8371554.1 tetratricopeptide repeat protein [Geminicoccaceae bacterium]